MLRIASTYSMHPDYGHSDESELVIEQPEPEPTDAEVEAMVAELCETLAKLEAKS